MDRDGILHPIQLKLPLISLVSSRKKIILKNKTFFSQSNIEPCFFKLHAGGSKLQGKMQPKHVYLLFHILRVLQTVCRALKKENFYKMVVVYFDQQRPCLHMQLHGQKQYKVLENHHKVTFFKGRRH